MHRARSSGRHGLASEEHSLGESPAPKRVPRFDLRLQLAARQREHVDRHRRVEKRRKVLRDAVHPAVVAVAFQEHQEVGVAPPPAVTPSDRSEENDRLDLAVGAPQRLRQAPERGHDRVAVKKLHGGKTR